MGLKTNGRLSFGSFLGRKTGTVNNQTGNTFFAGGQARFAGGLDSVFGSYPNANLAPGSFMLPQSSGAISSRNTARGTMAKNTALAYRAAPRSASASGTITKLAAALSRLVQMSAAASGTISKDTATLAGGAFATASGTISITAVDALLGAIFSVTASASGAIAKDDAFLTAIANMTAEAGGPTPLSPEGLADAVWSTILADYTTAGTAGQKLNDLALGGSAASQEDVENARDAILAEVEKRLKTSVYLGTK